MNDSNDVGRNLTVTVHNEDDGSVETLNAGPGTRVRVMVERAYRELELTPQPGDRIRCESGEDLTPHLELTLEELMEQTGCSLTWLFSGDQGGA